MTGVTQLLPKDKRNLWVKKNLHYPVWKVWQYSPKDLPILKHFFNFIYSLVVKGDTINSYFFYFQFIHYSQHGDNNNMSL